MYTGHSILHMAVGVSEVKHAKGRGNYKVPYIINNLIHQSFNASRIT